MLGSDPIAALLGAGLDARSPQVVWKGYLRRLAALGCAVTMLGPDVVLPDGIDAESLTALAELTTRYPSGTPMPSETTGKLSGLGQVDGTGERVNARVTAYFRRITKIVGTERTTALLDAGVITASAALHIRSSNMVAVVVPDAGALGQWRQWAAATSDDPHELHTAPTLLLPGLPGGGVYLFATPATVGEGQQPTVPGFPLLGDMSLQVGAARIDTGDVTVPVPPTRMGGHAVMRLGPCRKLPAWLESTLRASGNATAAPAA